MKARAFNGSDLTVSEVGLGCWQLGGSDWGDLSEADALDILCASLDRGVIFLDTADVYGMGRSETLIGKFLKQAPASVFVATKLGRYPEPGWPGNFTRDAVRAHTEASLRRLGRETLDLTQLHCVPREELEQGEVFGWLRELRQEGKIRHFGASVESMDEALICLSQEGLASLQIIFNIFRQKPINALFDQARRQNVALIVRLPLASGLLSGKYRHDAQFPAGDHRTYNRNGEAFNVGETFAGLPFETGVTLADALKPWVPAGMTMAQMALRWCLDFSAVTTVIPGAKSREMAAANAAVSELPPLPRDLHEALTRFYDGRVAEHIRGPY
jgi:aryl-alcohol dehydrogenase-like predicted oxidoreductase